MPTHSSQSEKLENAGTTCLCTYLLCLVHSCACCIAKACSTIISIISLWWQEHYPCTQWVHTQSVCVCVDCMALFHLSSQKVVCPYSYVLMPALAREDSSAAKLQQTILITLSSEQLSASFTNWQHLWPPEHLRPFFALKKDKTATCPILTTNQTWAMLTWGNAGIPFKARLGPPKKRTLSRSLK